MGEMLVRAESRSMPLEDYQGRMTVSPLPSSSDTSLILQLLFYAQALIYGSYNCLNSLRAMH